MCERLLSVREVAALLGIRRHGVLKLIADGELPKIDVSQKGSSRPLWRVSEDDLQAFIRRRTKEAKPKQRRRRKSATTVKRYF